MIKKIFAVSLSFAAATVLPTTPVYAGSYHQCLNYAIAYANSVAQPNTSEWETAWEQYIEDVCPGIIGSGSGGGGKDIISLCQQYECSFPGPTVLPSN